MNRPSGFLVLDKPLRLTSRDAVDRAAHWFPRGTRLGHTGTLDPLASGVLVIAVGLATRLVDYVHRMDKTYCLGVRLGARSDTDDAEGTITQSDAAAAPAPTAVEHALAGFRGVIAQVPPTFSAAKVSGRRAYVLARRGADLDLAARPVRIHDLRLVHYAYPDLDLAVRCGKGTYMRALARDLGDKLGCGGYVHALRRTRIGPFDESAALSLDVDADSARRGLLDLSWAAAGLPRVQAPAADIERFAQGQALPWHEAASPGEVGVFDATGRFVGIGKIDAERRLRPCKVFHVGD